jgi:cell division septation protein DedD
VVQDGQSKRRLGDIWAHLVESTCVLLVPPVVMAVGAMYLGSPSPQGPERQKAERANMEPELAGSEHRVIAERRPFDDGPPPFPQSQIAKDLARYKAPVKVGPASVTVSANLAADVPEQLPAASRGRATTSFSAAAAVEEAHAAASTRSSPRANESGTWVLQLSAQSTEEQAHLAVHTAQAKYAVLAGYQVLIRKKDQGGRGVFYAAQVGPLARDEATLQSDQQCRRQMFHCRELTKDALQG